MISIERQVPQQLATQGGWTSANFSAVSPIIDVRENFIRRPGTVLLARMITVAGMLAMAAAAGAWVGTLS